MTTTVTFAATTQAIAPSDVVKQGATQVINRTVYSSIENRAVGLRVMDLTPVAADEIVHRLRNPGPGPVRKPRRVEPGEVSMLRRIK